MRCYNFSEESLLFESKPVFCQRRSRQVSETPAATKREKFPPKNLYSLAATPLAFLASPFTDSLVFLNYL